MSTWRGRNRDLQEQVVRGLWGEVEEVPGAGRVMSVRGTGTIDYEVPILNTGFGFSLPANSDAEVIMLSLGSDVNDRVALPTLPRDAQHNWAPGAGGIQSPTDPERRVEVNEDETHLTDGNYSFGPNREYRLQIVGGAAILTVAGGLTLDGDLTVNGNVNLNGGAVTHNGTNIGDTHTHGGVDPGPGNTGAPN